MSKSTYVVQTVYSQSLIGKFDVGAKSDSHIRLLKSLLRLYPQANYFTRWDSIEWIAT